MEKPTRHSSLTHWLDWLLSLHAQEIDLGLTRVREVGQRLRLLQPKAKVITVAGTNGKGSSVAFLQSIYQAAGYGVGAYTSPHILRFNERIQINGAPVADSAIVEAFAEIEAARGTTKLTYFEFATLAGLWVFAQQPLDVIVLEVGLGGRLDAVNIVDADIALVTAIDVDHIDWLGSDKNQIALEKAGIMRAGKPAICSDPTVPQTLIDFANQLPTSLSLLGRDFGFEKMPKNDQAWLFLAQNSPTLTLDNPSLSGEFQFQNAAGVVAVVQTLQAVLPVTPAQISQGLAQAKHPGRLQWLTIEGQEWLIDVAHNPQSSAVLGQYLASQTLHFDSVIFSALSDKDMLPMVKAIQPFASQWLIADLKVPRATSLENLQKLLKTAGVTEQAVRGFESIAQAVKAARLKSSRVLVWGSFITVAQALAVLEQ
ncbi:bifunctional tetrahydrofolate synthase/dihydrofolate synthase [Thiosulfativibrio zosterae]|uniref:Dihydrofolate synthase/folylpolyglutamate synthase n=1 Tax=Thiosulfativibrio zosterae TaxID=2675053 RepID=A0A6F8PPB2_9GAMM|nr:bifunctional tetrahydrofolate synthase/dihydrofolate synthase [Thiosulfativibrio zosterae]BBP43953.1 bifunctional folylpolyglutamate synthase/dihydrofolate synthase [Thiosulfativibrio zosterae]